MKVSVIIPTYKRPIMLKRLLDSIALQTYSNYEVIVVDDFSPNTNEYKNVENEFKKKIKNFKFIYNKENRGACFSRNTGINNSCGEILAFVDDDDEWISTKLAKQVEVFKNNQEVSLVYTWAKIIGPSNKEIGESKESIEGNAYKTILNRCFIPSPSVAIRKVVFNTVGQFDESLPACQDWDMWTRILKKHKCAVVKSFETKYYKHEGETIGASPMAKIGFVKYYQKNLLSLLLHLQIRHLYRFFKWKIETHS